MSTCRGTLHAVVTSHRLVAIAVVVALLEGLLRLGLAAVVDPVAAVLCPPVIAVFGLTRAVPVVRSAMTDGVDSSPGSSQPVLSQLLPVVFVAVAGHVLAVVAGVALFLLVDTPIRYVLYWIGRGDLISQTVIVVTPLFGVAIGTLLSWVVPAIAVVRVADGATGTGGLRDAIVTAVTGPRAVGRTTAFQFGSIAFVGTVTVVSFWVGSVVDSGQGSGSLDTPVLPFVFGGLVAVFGVAAWLAFVLVLTVDRVESPAESSTARSVPWTSVPVSRLALVVVVLTALVATAGAVRMAEIRPVDTSPDSLPDDPDALYATALENTERSNHEYRFYRLTGDEDDGVESLQSVRTDRDDRRIVLEIDGQRPSYGSMGLVTPIQRWSLPSAILGSRESSGESRRTMWVLPGYPHFEDETYRLGEPSVEADGWTVREREGSELTLELTEPEDVFFVLTETEFDEYFENPEVHESRGTITVDTDRKVVSDGAFRLDVSDPDGPGRYDTHVGYEYDVDIDVERPDGFGAPSAGELVWRVFAY